METDVDLLHRYRAAEAARKPAVPVAVQPPEDHSLMKAFREQARAELAKRLPAGDVTPATRDCLEGIASSLLMIVEGLGISGTNRDKVEASVAASLNSLSEINAAIPARLDEFEQRLRALEDRRG